MSVTFSKAPLIELIAESRWTPQGSSSLGPTVPSQGVLSTIFLGGNKQEEFYTRVGSVLHKAGFNRSERLLPVGVPFMLHQPVYRFRSESEDKRSVIYQVGFGIFSVHAVPPYHSWSKFRPFVKNGMDSLLQSRPEADAKQSFGQASLRYIDFFGEQLTQGRDVQSFISDVFGISTRLPEALTKSAASGGVKSLFTKVVLPTKIGDLTVSVGDGQFNNRPGIIADWMASSYNVTAGLDVIVDAFDSAHALIHDLFLELTWPIHDLMEPQEAEV